MTIEIEKTYKITFTSEQLHELYMHLQHRESEMRGTLLGVVYKDIKDLVLEEKQ
jgi:hypothetical protein